MGWKILYQAGRCWQVGLSPVESVNTKPPLLQGLLIPTQAAPQDYENPCLIHFNLCSSSNVRWSCLFLLPMVYRTVLSSPVSLALTRSVWNRLKMILMSLENHISPQIWFCSSPGFLCFFFHPALFFLSLSCRHRPSSLHTQRHHSTLRLYDFMGGRQNIIFESSAWEKQTSNINRKKISF